MFGVNKKVEKVRKALYDAFLAKANELITSGEREKNQGLRAQVLLDIADVLRGVGVGEIDEDEER